MSPLDKLGVAISDAGITWTNEMRSAWDAAKNAELAEVDALVAMASTSSDAAVAQQAEPGESKPTECDHMGYWSGTEGPDGRDTCRNCGAKSQGSCQ